MKTPSVQATYRFTQFAHYGQKDWQGEPYALHPFWVSQRLKDQGFDDSYQRVALLHDVLEDTDIRVIHLIDLGFPEDEVEDVVLLSHFPHRRQSYESYIQRLLAFGSERALRVKLADLWHNTHPSRPPSAKKAALYSWAKAQIEARLEDMEDERQRAQAA